jgi:divalent metal cation (Fe/Co/Zn/Cd) transporter
MEALLPGESREKKSAALLSVGSALLLVSLKAFLVIRTGSLGVLSEALHSGLDLLAAIITFLSIRVSDQPADERHPYGHGKFENFSAFVETALLVVTALYIIYEAFDRLFFHSVHIQPSVMAILVLLVALSIDITRARKLSRVAAKYSSEALEADALHFSTDVWSTIVVISGTVAGVRGRAGRIDSGGGDLVGWLAAGKADAGCAAGRGAGRVAGTNHEGHRADGRSAERTASTIEASWEPLFRGRDRKRAAHGELAAGACVERCN